MALALCAEKKYGSKDDLQKFIDKVCAGKGPGTSGATVSRFLNFSVIESRSVLHVLRIIYVGSKT